MISGSQWGLRCVYSELEMTACLIENNLVNGVNIRDGKLTAQRQPDRRQPAWSLPAAQCRGRSSATIFPPTASMAFFLKTQPSRWLTTVSPENGRAGVRWLNSKGRLARNLIAENGVYGLINDGHDRSLKPVTTGGESHRSGLILLRPFVMVATAPGWDWSITVTR